jgi:hypothetical protein
MPGGLQFNGRQILDDANEELEKIMFELRERYEVPPMGFLG